MKKIYYLLAIFLIALMPLGAAQDANVLRLATDEDWETLDPAYAAGVQTGAMVAKLFDGLMRYDYSSTEVIPNLAESYEVSDDATVFTFTLHEGVRFHDGSELTAEDVKYSFERIVDPETASPVNWVLQDALITGTQAFIDGEAEEISGIEVVDPRTLRITLDAPYALFLFHLAMPATHVVPQAVASELGDQFSSNPVGTGPFRLAERVRDSSLSLEANEDYFAGAPTIAGAHYRIITDPLITWQEFTVGNLDVAGVPDALFNEITGDPQYEAMIETTPELAVFYWALNQRFEPFQDVRVRRAIAMAIDREAILEGPYNGKDLLANSPIPPGLPGYEELPGIGYDPEGARQLLAEAGYPDGFALTIWSSRSPTTIAVNELIQFFLSEVGINADINQVDFGTLIDAAISGTAPAFLLSWYADYADAYNFLHPLFVASNAQRYGYENPEVTALVEEAATEPELEDRIPLYQQANRLITEDVPVVYLRYPVSYYAVRPGVEGILNHPIFNADKFMLVDLSASEN
ncbi:MAG: ABC transporter substrate-binding protein [Deinococcota bacterium]|nr:ABC transporter substrate-binding protein [Deinococcota bacterium]